MLQRESEVINNRAALSRDLAKYIKWRPLKGVGGAGLGGSSMKTTNYSVSFHENPKLRLMDYTVYTVYTIAFCLLLNVGWRMDGLVIPPRLLCAVLKSEAIYRHNKHELEARQWINHLHQSSALFDQNSVFRLDWSKDYVISLKIGHRIIWYFLELVKWLYDIICR